MDEHISPDVAEVFRQNLRTIEVAKHPGMRGRDERDYLHELIAQNMIFVTGDMRWIDEVIERRVRHAGIVVIQRDLAPDEKVTFAWIALGRILGTCAESRTAFRGRVLYAQREGLREVFGNRDELVISWSRLNTLSETQPTVASRRAGTPGRRASKKKRGKA